MNKFQKYRVDNIKQKKFKENWKLAYRRDEMNVLRFSTSCPAEGKFIRTA